MDIERANSAPDPETERGEPETVHDDAPTAPGRAREASPKMEGQVREEAPPFATATKGEVGSDANPVMDRADLDFPGVGSTLLEGDRRDYALILAIHHAEEMKRRSASVEVAARELMWGFGLKVTDVLPILETWNSSRDSPIDYQELWELVQGEAGHPDQEGRSLGWRLSQIEKDDICELTVGNVIRRADELIVAKKIEFVLGDGDFLKRLAMLEHQDRAAYKSILVKFRKLRGWKQRRFEERFDRYQRRIASSRRQAGLNPHPAMDLVPTKSPPAYYWQDGSTFVSMTNDRGEITRECIANFQARIVESVTNDDGAERSKSFTIEARSAKGPDRTRAIDVPAKDFESMNWVVTGLGAEFSIVAGRGGNRDHARAAIQELSSDFPERIVYTFTGWKHLEGRWIYLHAGGGIGADGNDPSFRVEVAGPGSGYCLPDPPEGEERARAVRASLGILDLADGALAGSLVAAAVLFGATYRSAIQHANFSIQFHGRTGSLKSSVAALAQQHFGRIMDANHLPASWANDTVLAIGDLATRIGDGILVVDDFIPRGSSQDISRKHAEVQSFFQMIGNHAGRQRLRQDGSPRPSRPPNCLPISTGEDRLHVGSADARTLPVRFTVGMIDKAGLAHCQDQAASGLYAASMAAFLRWMAPRLEQARADLAERVRELRGELFREGDHGRTPEILAQLIFGAETFLCFAVEAGAITREESDAHLSAVMTGLAEVSEEVRADRLAELDPCDSFIGHMTAALAGGRAYLESSDNDHAPDGMEGLSGWRLESRNSSCGETEWVWKACPNAERLGWVDGDTILLQPGPAYAMVRKMTDAEGQGFATSKRSLCKMLEERGMLDTNRDSGRDRGGKHRVAGRIFIPKLKKQIAVLAIPAKLFWPPEDLKETSQPAE